MSYHNTVKLSGRELEIAREDCKKDEMEILEFFLKELSNLSPCDVWVQLYQGHMTQNQGKKPITSVRRAITDLTDKGYLEKGTEEQQKIGYFGRKVNTWHLKSKK